MRSVAGTGKRKRPEESVPKRKRETAAAAEGKVHAFKRVPTRQRKQKWPEESGPNGKRETAATAEGGEDPLVPHALNMTS